MRIEKERLERIECEKRERERCEEEQRIQQEKLEKQKLEQEKIEKEHQERLRQEQELLAREQLLREQMQLNNAQLERSKLQLQEKIHQKQFQESQQQQQNQIVSDQAAPPDKENERQEKLRKKQQTRENLRKEQEKLRLYKQKHPQMINNNNSKSRVYHQPIHYSFLEGRVWEQILPMDFCIILEQACMSIHLGFPFNNITDVKVFKESLLKSPSLEIQKQLTELVFNDYMISFLPGLCYEVLEEDDEHFNGHVDYQEPLEIIFEKEYLLNEYQRLVKNNPCPKVKYHEKEQEEDVCWRSIPIIIEPELSKFEITELSDESPSEDNANAIMDDDQLLTAELEKNLLSSDQDHHNQKTTQRSISSESRPFLEITEVVNNNNPEDEEDLSFVSCSCDNDHEVKIIVTQDESVILAETNTNISKSTNDFSVEDQTANAQVCSLDNHHHDNNLNSNRSHNTSISDITLSQDSLLVIDCPVTSDSNPDDVNKEIEQVRIEKEIHSLG